MKIGFHPFSSIVLLPCMQRYSTPIDESKYIFPPADNELQSSTSGSPTPALLSRCKYSISPFCVPTVTPSVKVPCPAVMLPAPTLTSQRYMKCFPRRLLSKEGHRT